jgi:hypothetical protein
MATAGSSIGNVRKISYSDSVLIDAFKDNTAILFSLNNVGVVVLSTIVGWFFGERPVARVFWGMGLAILSILVLAF